MPPWTTPALAAAACLAVAMLAAAPLLPVPLAGVLYAAGSLICHQLPERSFHLAADQLPVCARCFGLYTGGAVGAMAGALLPLPVGRLRMLRLVMRPARWPLTAIAAIPTLVTFTLEWGAGWPVSNMARAAAAVPLGIAVACVVTLAAATLHYEQCTPPRPPERDPSPPLRT